MIKHNVISKVPYLQIIKPFFSDVYKECEYMAVNTNLH